MDPAKLRKRTFLPLIVLFVPLSIYFLAIGDYLLFAVLAGGTWFLSKILDKRLPKKP